MGCLTAKASGTVASFINPTVTDIESARVYFSPTQLGEGTPSPENVREIIGRTGVELYRNKKSIVPFLKDSISPTSYYNGFFEWSTAWKIPDRTKKYTYYVYIDNTKGTQSAKARLWFGNEDNSAYVSIKSSESVNVGNAKWVSIVATIDENSYYICFGLDIYAGTTAKHPMVFEGNKNQTETIPFSWKRLPDEYQEVEYIESDGEQYIKTNYIPQNFDSIKCLFSMSEFYESSSTYWTLFSAGVGTYQLILLLAKTSGGVDGAYYKYFASGSASRFNFSPNIDTKYEIDINSNGIISCNDYTAQSNYQNAVDTPLYLMMRANNASPFKGKIYKFSIINNGINMINLIPCYRKSDNEIGMYDTVSQTFYTNQGTGTFLKGDDAFSSEVYGGYVDLAKGELVETYNNVVVGFSKDWVSTSNYLYRTDNLLPSIGGRDGYVKTLCSHTKNPYDVTTAIVVSTVGYVSFGKKFFESANIEMTSEALNQYLEEQNNNGTPLQICYLLKTPIIHQLTPTQLQTLKNENNIWSDGDSVEIDYDLAETFDIQKAKRKIIMNQPHVESASKSPSSPQVIKFKTDMRAPLKQCIVNFAPIQEGSGDPSPTNIRPIKGWNGITLKHTGINMLQCNSPSYYIDATNNGITSQSSRNADNEIIGIDFNGTTTSTNIFRNLNYNPSDSGAVTMPRGLMGLTGYSDQIYIIPMGNGNIPRTTDGRYWSEANTNSENGWNVWSVDSSETYNGLWVRTQIFPRETNVNVDATVYPMMCLAEDVGCEFEPYKGETFDVDWTDDAGTVYGGYIDLVKGELVAEWIERMINSFDWSYNSSGECFRASTNIKGKSVNAISPIQSKIYKTTKVYNSISYWLNVDDFSISEHTGISSQGELINSIHIKDSRYTTVSDFLNGIGNESIIYELAEPIHYSLTPQQIITFKGQNNIWANTNKLTEIKYWNHKKSDLTGVIWEAENLTFDGTNYIDTRVYLFSEENINKDFEVVIEDLYGDYETGSRTIVCAKYDSGAIGFLIRLNDSTSITYNGTISMKSSYNNNITIRRINGVITCEGSIINNPRVKFTNEVHQHPLVLGCALQDDGTPYRYATGTIGHITVKWL